MTLPKWLYLVQMLGPAILNSFGVPTELTGAIVDGVNEAEQIPDATGPDKKQHVLNIVADAITAVNAAKGRTLLDPLRVKTVAGDAIDLVVEAVDLVHDRTTEPNQLNVPAAAQEPAIPSSTLQHALRSTVTTTETFDDVPPSDITQGQSSAAQEHEHADEHEPEDLPAKPAHPESTDHRGNAEKRHGHTVKGVKSVKGPHKG